MFRCDRKRNKPVKAVVQISRYDTFGRLGEIWTLEVEMLKLIR